jgi:hypothetical protein
MTEDFLTKLLLLVVGALAGILSGIAGTAFKNRLDRKAEGEKAKASFWVDYLYPLRVAAGELRDQIVQIHKKVAAEKDIPEKNLREDYNLRKWFQWAKDHVIGVKDNLSDEQRRANFAMHSGGIGCEAVSTLYVTGYYLFFATRIRLRMPSTGGDDELVRCINEVRKAFSELDFYRVTQDSTGVSMKSKTGDVMNYREFGEAMTDKTERGWFLTLADTYFKLHQQDPAHVQSLIQHLDDLISVVDQRLGPGAAQRGRQVL